MDNPFAGDGNSFYPDPDPNGEIPRLWKRNREDEDEEENANHRKKKKKQKKTQDDTPQRLAPKSTSGKQYQKEMQRKLLEEAKRNDQFILVAARMKGKSKIVKLRLDSDLLEAIQNRPVLERPAPIRERDSSEEPVGDSGNILQSDLMTVRKPTVTPAQKEKASKVFRVRVNEDETYSTRKRNPEASQPGKPGRPGHRRSRFEEITIDSEEEDDDEFMSGYGGPGASRSTGRTSNWLARKNEGEEDLPTELPKDFRDGLINSNREKNIERNRIRNAQLAERKKSTPSKLSAKIHQPSAERPRKSTGELPDDPAGADEDGVGEEDDQSGEALLLAQSAAAALEARRKAEEEKARAAAAEREAQENLRAKMGIAEEYLDGSENESINGFIHTLAAEDEPLAHERNAEPSSLINGSPLQPTNSIFSKPGMEGKKIRIVSKRGGEGTTTTVKAGFTSVNKTAKSINVSESESDSEDEIPATAPAPKKPVGRRPGRPALKPTRGTSSAGRGRPRGRPRKTV